VNIRRLEGTLEKIVRNKAVIQQKIDYIDSQLGVPATDQEPAHKVKPKTADDYLKAAQGDG
jgi:hypothetical protein